MGILKGTFTFMKYRVIGELPDHFSDFIDKQIKLFAFREDLYTGINEKMIGWTSLENVLDTNFEYVNYSIGDYLVFALRLDKKSVPPALLRLKTLEAEKKFLKEQGKEKIYKEQRQDIKETVRLSLLEKTPAVPFFFEVCWAVSQNWLIFGSLSKKVTEDFEDLFKRTFNLRLIPFIPWDPAFMESPTVEKLPSLLK